ncbi:hypothetical protein GCM10011343_11110 [Flavobacterium orientale]|uniref:O-Antigen ligase n=2 Tax=Flavobacterium orientale TaxID=1756020 RepID=A0A916XYW1_9FLAO|nr:hypothetical protein GCM10011343_11110 [Flavobacterium orientale]
MCIGVTYLDSYELTFGVWSLSFILSISRNYAVSIIKLIIPYILIILIAFIVTWRYEYEYYFIIRDITYLGKPILGFLLGYQLCKKNLKNAFDLIINTGLFIAICHIIIIIIAIVVYNARTVAVLRHYSGFFSDYEIYTFIILLFHNQFELNYSKKKLWIYTIVIGFSAFMYLARTNFIQFLILFLALKGFLVLNKKSVAIIGSIILLSIVSYTAIYNSNPRRSAEGIEGFLYKIKVAPMEAFKTKINRGNWKEFHDNYRSYENIMTIRQVTGEGTAATLFGKGLGSRIDLRQEVSLGGTEQRFISILHNGFMIVFLKSGLLGLLIYSFTIIYFFRKVESDNNMVNQINFLFLGTGIFLFVSNWVFLGFYNLTESKSILIGFLIAYRQKLLK